MATSCATGSPEGILSAVALERAHPLVGGVHIFPTELTLAKPAWSRPWHPAHTPLPVNKALDESGSAACAVKKPGCGKGCPARAIPLVSGQDLAPRHSCSQRPYPSCPVACHSTCKVHPIWRTSEDATLRTTVLPMCSLIRSAMSCFACWNSSLVGLYRHADQRAVALQPELAGPVSTACPNTSAHTFRVHFLHLPVHPGHLHEMLDDLQRSRTVFRTFVVGRIA